jgi:hypothetical protein
MLHSNYFIINHVPPVKTPIFSKVNDISVFTVFVGEKGRFGFTRGGDGEMRVFLAGIKLIIKPLDL